MARKQTQEDRKRYQILSRMLKDRQLEIRNKLRSLRQVLPAELGQVKDTEEQSMEDFVLGMDFALMEMESETLHQIDEALLRLDEGVYGTCAECEGPISEARLAALPFASLCRDCQEQQEEEARTPQPRVRFEGEVPTRGRRAPAAEKPSVGQWGSRPSQL
jgi:RNA polymerase-binding transcription factor